ncbi:MAG TPA: hypothetical protein GX503_05760 [Clostridiales bacterium]|nr:hypothetical protein [Clostridiales bacterium]
MAVCEIIQNVSFAAQSRMLLIFKFEGIIFVINKQKIEHFIHKDGKISFEEKDRK